MRKSRITFYKVISIIFMIFIFTYVPIKLVISNSESNYTNLSFPIISVWLISFFICLIKLIQISLSKKSKYMELFFYVFLYVFLIIVPMLQISSNRFPWYGIYSQEIIIKALFFILIGTIFYMFGFNYKFKVSYRKKIVPKVINEKKAIVIVVLYSSISLIMVFLNGVEKLFMTRVENENLAEMQSSVSSELISSNLQKVPIFIALIIFFIAFKKTLKFKNVNLYLFITLIILNLIISNPIANPRFWFGTVIFSIFILIMPTKKYSMFLWVSIIMFTLLMIFPYADVFRVSLNSKLEFSSITDQLISNGDYDAFQQMLNTIVFVDDDGLTMGKQLLGAILFFFPRFLWSEKPIGTGATVAEHLGYHFTNLSSPLWAEGYVNFGLIGIMIFMFVYGIFSNAIQNKFNDSSENEHTLSKMIIPFIAPYQLFLLRGDLMNGIAYMSLIIIFSIISFKYMSEKIGVK